MSVEDASIETETLAREMFTHYLEMKFIEKYLSSRCLSLSLEERDDLAQDVKLKVLMAIDRFEWDGETAFRSWLITIIENTRKNYLKIKGRFVPFGENLELVGGVVLEDPCNRIDARKRLMQVMTLLEDGIICESQANFFRLHYLKGFSVDEIAKGSNKTKNEVYDLLTRMRANLLLEIKGLDPDDTDHDFDIYSPLAGRALGHLSDDQRELIQSYFIERNTFHDLFTRSSLKTRGALRTRISNAYKAWVEIIKYLTPSHGN